MVDLQIARKPVVPKSATSSTDVPKDARVLYKRVQALKAETSGASEKRQRKHSLHHENNQTRNPSKPAASELVNDDASSVNLPPDSSPGFVLPAQYPTIEVGTVRMQNPDVFPAQQQIPSFGNLQFDPYLALYANSPVPLVFGNAFVTAFDQPSIVSNDYLTDEQISLGVAFQAYNYPGQNN